MHTLHHYQISYRFNGAPLTHELESFEPVTEEEAVLQLLIKHVEEPQVVVDAPWERHAQPSIARRAQEAGLSDIEVSQRD
ncbi:hypothetical protein I5L56_04480 [Pseudomonas oryzihabitans]|uniref:hypothetical protein n=1 Tax=Pseudomonas oryzihabitans TaxID=47885 RepID=UPI0018D7A5DE|nr:hypothetical protein [Pseudomonas oryzihabitans]MBH3328867.1 hypothetical protein [Pseudomonas oryzihabitans]